MVYQIHMYIQDRSISNKYAKSITIQSYFDQ